MSASDALHCPTSAEILHLARNAGNVVIFHQTLKLKLSFSVSGWSVRKGRPALSQMLTELRGLTTPCPGPASLSLLRRFSGKLSMESASVVSRVLPLPLNFKFSFQFRKFLCCDLKFKCKFFLLRIAVEVRVSVTSLLWISF